MRLQAGLVRTLILAARAAAGCSRLKAQATPRHLDGRGERLGHAVCEGAQPGPRGPAHRREQLVAHVLLADPPRVPADPRALAVHGRRDWRWHTDRRRSARGRRAADAPLGEWPRGDLHDPLHGGAVHRAPASARLVEHGKPRMALAPALGLDRVRIRQVVHMGTLALAHRRQRERRVTSVPQEALDCLAHVRERLCADARQVVFERLCDRLVVARACERLERTALALLVRTPQLLELLARGLAPVRVGVRIERRCLTRFCTSTPPVPLAGPVLLPLCLELFRP